MSNQLARVFRALARSGLLVREEGPVFCVSRPDAPDAPEARVLLPRGFRLDRKALSQLAAFAGVSHPAGGKVCAACATPDLHAGALVPVGAVLATSELVIPQAIGTDIQCGMRLHVVDLELDAFLARKSEWIALMKGDLLLGTRDLPMRVSAVRAMFEAGALGWLEATREAPLGMLARADLDQLERELERSFGCGSEDGDADYAPSDLLPDERDVVRDSCMGTTGGGNHFVEVQLVEEVLDRARAFAWGVRLGQLAVMVHSGSRRVGAFIGGEWMARARERWPEGVAHPPIFSLHGEDAAEYVTALHTAANYANVNRLLLAELVRDRLREVFGRELEAPLVFDAPHNTITREGERYVHRKGATPAHAEQPVLIPGSMGQPSFLMVGLGNEAYLSSASHGAGRARTRGEMRKRELRGEGLGLEGVECVSLKRERLVEEAPLAYNAVGPVVEVQADVGIAKPVARMRPIVTFKA